ncbi:hypothetical protein LTR64_005012 [Lithohypha guttulata]|uniref:uncharacterized protein n=1 Tax=Lithohypha guttulata TaxID=1690604 RepID=UPI002DE0E664|nr:hypothetical protein LTR51_005152 [Lithohypha guttulata]
MRQPAPPSWSSIPKKFELAIICSVRIVDFFQQAALQAFMFYQLASYSPDTSESEISFQVGVLQGVFTAAQIVTSVIWGRAADSPTWGRKRVILASLIGQAVSCIGVAFSTSFATAVIWRTLGGAVNATVGGARTALFEKTEKKYHSRTSLLLPLAWNIANIFGPPVGGLLSDPVRYYPALFGDNSLFGGANGVTWMKTYPYALPNLFCALVLFADAVLVFLFLEETLKARQGRRDRGLELAAGLQQFFVHYVLRRSGYQSLNDHDPRQGTSLIDDGGSASSTSMVGVPKERSTTPPGREATNSSTLPRVLTKNIILTLTTVAFLDFQLGGFTALWSMFLSSEKRDPVSGPKPHLPFKFTGGLGFSPSVVGLAMSILGFVGIICQFVLYPRVNARFGLLRSTIYSLFFFPIAYVLAPYLSLLASNSDNQVVLWSGITLVALILIGARTFAIPGVVLLTNNASPSPEVLGTVHGLGAADIWPYGRREVVQQWFGERHCGRAVVVTGV